MTPKLNRILLATMAAASLTSFSFNAGAAEGETAEYWLRMPAAFKCPTPGCSATNTNPGDGSGEEGQPQPETPAVPWVLALQAATLPEAIQGRPYSTNLSNFLSISRGDEQASASEASWRLGTGSLPDGLTLNNGEISGTPSTATTGASFQVIASYQNAEGQQTYTLVVGGYFLTNVKQLSVGPNNACVVTAVGGVKCWGFNNYGQLGNNSTTNSAVPVDVQGLTSGVASVSPGLHHTCAVTTSGGAKCWGNNSYGQLGTNSTTNSAVPVDVQGLTSGVASVVAGYYHTCALTTAGGVKCWGLGASGQLGNNSTTNSAVPVDVQGLSSGVASVHTKFSHVCVLTTVGGVKCWGDNNQGQLGNHGATTSRVPVDVQGLASGVIGLTSGSMHNCVVTTARDVKCWGFNAHGQLGDNSTTASKLPVSVYGLTSGVASVSAGYQHTCAVTTAGGVKCWGNNPYGQLGTNSGAASKVPLNVYGLSSGASVVDAGTYHTCAATTTGDIKCWGQNTYGQLGNNSNTSYSLIPLEVHR